MAEVTLLIGVGLVTVYSKTRGPAARVESACKAAEISLKINQETLKKIPNLSSEHQKEVEDAQDHKDALWQ